MTTWKNCFWTNTVNFSDCNFLCGVCVLGWGGRYCVAFIPFIPFEALEKTAIMIDQHQSLMSEVSERRIHTEAAHNKI